MFILPLGEALDLQILDPVSFVEDFQFLAELLFEFEKHFQLLADAELALRIDDLRNLVHADVASLWKLKRLDISLR